MVPTHPDEIFTTCTFSAHPYSRGSIHANGPDIEDGYTLRTGMLTDPDNVDLKTAVWMYKVQREIIRRMDCYRGEVVELHPPFPVGSDAEAKHRTAPLGPNVDDIVYTAADNAILEEWLHETVSANWHSMGTSSMAPADKKGVVDRHLSVHGIQNLKVADISILPSQVNANTNHMAFTIGEKAASIIIDEL